MMGTRTKIPYAAAPRVDLLPDAQRAELLHERTLPKVLLAIIVAAVLAAMIWAAGLVPVFFATQERDRLQGDSTALINEIASYQDAQELLNAVGSRNSDRETLTATEVLFMPLRDQIAAAVPEGSWLARFEAVLGAAAAGDAEALEADLASVCRGAGTTVTLTVASPGTANGLDRAAQLIDGVSAIDG